MIFSLQGRCRHSSSETCRERDLSPSKILECCFAKRFNELGLNPDTYRNHIHVLPPAVKQLCYRTAAAIAPTRKCDRIIAFSPMGRRVWLGAHGSSQPGVLRLLPTERPHQAKENRPLIESSSFGQLEGEVVRDERLGGMLKHYRRDAA